MAVYEVRLTIKDHWKRLSSQTLVTQDLVDEAAALAAAAAAVADWQALSTMGVVSYTVGQRIVVNETPAVGSSRDAGLTMSILKTNGKKSPIRVKSPESSIFDGNGNLDIGNTLANDFVDNFKAAGDFTFSDGENALEIDSGYLDE